MQYSNKHPLWCISPSFPGVFTTLGQVNHVLLSSMPRAEPSRLAWLSQTLIAMASGRINQNYYIFEAMMICASSHTFLNDLRFFLRNKQNSPKTCFWLLFLGISGHFNECPHRHNTNVRTDNPSKLSKVLGDSRRVLHLNSLTILVVKTIYTLRTEVRREKLSQDNSSQKGALTY